MLNRFLRALRGGASPVTPPERSPAAVSAGPLAELPREAVGVGGLDRVPLPVVCAYTGLRVVTVRPLDRLGPEGSGIIGGAIRRRLRDAGVGDPGLELGELVPGQNAARLQRMRERGVSEEQIAMFQAAMQQRLGAIRATGWTIDVADGHHASVTVLPVGDDGGSHDHSRFSAFRAQYVSENSGPGRWSATDDLWEIPMAPIVGGPYEAYYQPGHLVARGEGHDADATASALGGDDLRHALAALAFLALASIRD
ncbi:MAG: hypothetical protein U0Y82_10140 [Thermoleophilia bacterium]